MLSPSRLTVEIHDLKSFSTISCSDILVLVLRFWFGDLGSDLGSGSEILIQIFWFWFWFGLWFGFRSWFGESDSNILVLVLVRIFWFWFWFGYSEFSSVRCSVH